jgi:hypothetical protein
MATKKHLPKNSGNSFSGSTETLIDAGVLDVLRNNFAKSHIEGTEIQLHKDFSKTKIKIYHPPQENHAYIIGADPSMGTKADFHAMTIFDITNAFKVVQVATYHDNEASPKLFAYMLAKIGRMYNSAYIAMEDNGVSQVTLDALWRDFEYENIICEGGKGTMGIHSNNNRKMIGCIALKNFLEDEMKEIEINDGRLIAELETFERKSTAGKMPTYRSADGHDDFVMATVWCMFSLDMKIADRYYDIKKTVLNNLGEQTPLLILPMPEDANDRNEKMRLIDEKMVGFKEAYTNGIETGKNAIEAFIRENKLNAFDTSDPEEPAIRRPSEDEAFTFQMFK